MDEDSEAWQDSIYLGNLVGKIRQETEVWGLHWMEPCMGTTRDSYCSRGTRSDPQAVRASVSQGGGKDSETRLIAF